MGNNQSKDKLFLKGFSQNINLIQENTHSNVI